MNIPRLLLLAMMITLINCKTAYNHYSVSNAHSHNDYEQSSPFYKAFNAGFGSIEADVYAVNGALMVAHDKKNIQPQRTLSALYLSPLTAQLNTQPKRKIALLVDVKEDYKTVLPLLVEELKPLSPYLSTPTQQNRLTIIISGDRPFPAEYKNYPDYIFFDDNFVLPHASDEWKRVGLVSMPFDKLSKWNGMQAIDALEEAAIKNKIDNVHARGKRIRFWAAPDTEASHALQKKLHADFIGTDHIDSLAAFLHGR